MSAVEDWSVAVKAARDRGLEVVGADLKEGTLTICVPCSLHVRCVNHPDRHPYAREWE